jgi:UDP-GlcNAc:undecaprenyl-phosphate GlcNAc-1-phosphate transferase
MFNTNTIFTYIAAFSISALLIPVIKRIAIHFNLYAQQNERTIHHGKIARIGGVAIYIAFVLTAGYLLDFSRKMEGIMLGATIMFLTGLVDDICNIKPRTKIIMQVISAIVLIYFGVKIDTLRLPFGISINLGIISVLFTIAWVIGVTNAINLIDGLDGLAGGMCSTILVIIAFTAMIEGKTEIVHICLLLVFSIGGFMLYNIHPASIFMGDCGSLLLGFMISAISLVGFKSSTVMTLALPILILFIPITDTISAILRRTLANKKFSEADKQHIHHQLMKRFGQGPSVIILCSMTALFGVSAFLYLIDKEVGFMLMLVIIFALELFVEKSGMIAENWHPICSILHRIALALHIKLKETKKEESIKEEA